MVSAAIGSRGRQFSSLSMTVRFFTAGEFLLLTDKVRESIRVRRDVFRVAVKLDDDEIERLMVKIGDATAKVSSYGKRSSNW